MQTNTNTETTVTSATAEAVTVSTPTETATPAAETTTTVAKTGRGRFTATPRTYTLDGKDYTYSGRGRYPKELIVFAKSKGFNLEDVSPEKKKAAIVAFNKWLNAPNASAVITEVAAVEKVEGTDAITVAHNEAALAVAETKAANA